MLKLKKPGSRPIDDHDGPSATRSNSASNSNARESLRSVPPPRGSGYSSFLDWASGEALDPSIEERMLALRAWKGDLDQPNEEDFSPTPRM